MKRNINEFYFKKSFTYIKMTSKLLESRHCQSKELLIGSWRLEDRKRPILEILENMYKDAHYSRQSKPIWAADAGSG